MAKRQLYLVILMVIALGYGAYELLFTGSKRTSPEAPSPAASVDLNTFVADLAKGLQKSKDEKRVEQVAALCAETWPSDPFWDQEYGLQQFLEPLDTGETGDGTGLIYSGFVELGDFILAIINNIEYEQGELVEPGNYKVEEIYRTRVVLARQPDGKRFVLQLDE